MRVKVSKLLPKKYLHEISHGHLDSSRCTGESTAEALRVISEAISSPHEYIEIVDRSFKTKNKSYQRTFFVRMVETLIAKLAFDHLEVKLKHNKLCLYYNIYQTYESKVIWEKVDA